MGASLQQMEVVLHILLVAYQAMKLSGQHWPVIPESTQERSLQRLTGRIRCAEGLAAEPLQRAVRDSIDEHGEPYLLAFACRPPPVRLAIRQRLREERRVGTAYGEPVQRAVWQHGRILPCAEQAPR